MQYTLPDVGEAQELAPNNTYTTTNGDQAWHIDDVDSHIAAYEKSLAQLIVIRNHLNAKKRDEQVQRVDRAARLIYEARYPNLHWERALYPVPWRIAANALLKAVDGGEL